VLLSRNPIEHPELINQGDHLVQFYKDDSHLTETVTNFIAPALMNGEGVVLIATSEHLEQFEASLKSLYINTPFLKLTNQLVMLEAHETLAKFMVNGLPDTSSFNNYIGKKMGEMSAQFPSVKAYGEMVNILWAQGNLYATMELEKLWNSLLSSYEFVLLCAYSMDSMHDEKNGIAFNDICQCHSHVIPAEGILEVDNHKDQLKKIAELQVKISSGTKCVSDLKVNGLEMMIPLTALKIHLRDLKNTSSEYDLKTLVLKCEHQLDRIATITEKLRY
jgi:hypothetical protein